MVSNAAYCGKLRLMGDDGAWHDDGVESIEQGQLALVTHVDALRPEDAHALDRIERGQSSARLTIRMRRRLTRLSPKSFAVPYPPQVSFDTR